MRAGRTTCLGICLVFGIAGLASTWHDQGVKSHRSQTQARPIAKQRPVSSHTVLKPASKTVVFNRDILPILSQHCWPCHGNEPEALAKTGNMRLNTFAGATADRGGYRAVEPGHPEKSRLIQRINEKEEAMRMPPPGAPVKPLSDAEKKLLYAWIKEGGEFTQHWAYVPPKMPALPTVSDPKWNRNPVDRLVSARLAESGLKPEPGADAATLVRRATLALTGLPPTPKEVAAYLADKRPDAYERLLDRLLASPRYGENMARYWLDAVRYADTHGLHIDNERAVFPYRDWVVRAYNEDLPFDRFTTWQLAGDLLPNPTTEQKTATGYIRMNPTTNEGGVIEAEFLAKNTFDRVDTTATIFMGATFGCTKCHDHKYDPYTQRDYYSMYAYFNSTADPVLDGNLKLHQPVMKAPTPDEDRTLKGWEKQLRSMEDAVGADAARLWASENAPELPAVGKWEVSEVFPAKDFDAAFATDFGPEKPEGKATWKPIELALDALKPTIIGKDNAAVYLRTTLTVRSQVKTGLRLGSDDGIRVWLNGKLVHDNKVLRPPAPDQDAVAIELQPGANALLIKIVNAGGGDAAFVGLGDAASKRLGRLHDLAGKASLADAERRELSAGFLELGPETPASKAYRGLLSNYKKLLDTVPYTYIAQEMEKPRETFILKRGAYDLPGDPVSRAIPKVFGTLPPSYPKNRLGLAKWFTDPKNPLTARVTVNRLWQQFFGTGIVKSSEDFGSRGEWPSNPELLDYLALRFVKDGWSTKKLVKLVLSSQAFRQASTASAAKRGKDPDNQLVSRGPRFRLDAEVIRDTALYVSGLLVEREGGRADKPYQPPGIWEIIAYPISDTARYVQDHGDALYRRSLYMFWKRTSPPPTMLLFDAPMREACTVRRSRTNTPTQALATLNETGFFEAARAMAARVMESAKSDEARLRLAFECATSRAPTSKEKALLLKYLNDERRTYRANPQAAMDALSIGESLRDTSLPLTEHAAWLLVCNLILNLDETMTQH